MCVVPTAHSPKELLVFEVGHQVAARYVVEALSGSGDLAHVFRVRHVELDSVHTLKVLAGDAPELAARMRQEARKQAQLQHPNLVRVADVLLIGSHVALLMEYVEGQTLEQYIHERGALRLDEALSLMVPILGAVGAAHDANVLHGDLKPADVVLERHGATLNPKVMDFGVAQAMVDSRDGASVLPNRFLGGTAYRAPEQLFDAGHVTPAVDVFALGVMLQYCLTGVDAFEPSGADRPLGELLIRQRRPMPDGLTDSVRAAIRVAMSSEPSNRFAHIGDFAQALFKDYPVLRRPVDAAADASGGLHPQAFTTGAPVGHVDRPIPSSTRTAMDSARSKPLGLLRSERPLVLAALLMVGVVGLLWWWMAQNPAVSEGPVYPAVMDVIAPSLPPAPVVEEGGEADRDTTNPGG